MITARVVLRTATGTESTKKGTGESDCDDAEPVDVLGQGASEQVAALGLQRN